MPINIDHWCTTTGLFYYRVYAVIPNNKSSYDCSMKILIFSFLFLGGMLQRSILGPLLFLVYINDLSKYLSSTAKVFADYTSIFSVVHDISLSSLAYQWKMRFSSNVHDISLSLLAYQRKMSFNPKVTNQV